MAITGSFAFDNLGFPKSPLTKRWQPQRLGTRGTREPIFSSIQRLELTFGTLEVTGENDFFESRFLAGGLYNARLPHPTTGKFITFTGTAIEEYNFEFSDVDNVGGQFWAFNPRMVLSIDLQATGT